MTETRTDPAAKSPAVTLLVRMLRGAAGPLVGAVALFALPLAGAALLDTESFAFWAILSSISTVALSLDFGGVALLTARFHAERRRRLVLVAGALSALGAVIVGLVACMAWLLYTNTDMGRSVPLQVALTAIGAMALASAVRSILMVYAQAALIVEDQLLRNLTTAGQALLASVITIVVLAIWHTYWALPLGWLLSGLIVLVPTVWMGDTRLKLREFQPTIHQDFRLTSFASVRTLSTLLGAASQQGDRWVVGAIGGPTALAAYEIAWRFAMLPRFLVQNLTIRVGADSASMMHADKEKLHRLVSLSVRLGTVVTVVASAAVAAGYGTYIGLLGAEPEWLLLAAMLCAFGALGIVSPFSFTGAALGRGGIDIPYLALILIASITVAVISALNGDVWIFIFGYLLATVCGAAALAIYAPRLLSQSLLRRSSASASEREI